ncbi:MAG: hypothetical protein OK474_08250 [Thaumarchaeota archaeon]|nr:hypothetical protein [Nitrososphaerota archaeon]
MSAGTVLAGLIVSALGLVGLMQLYGFAVLPFNLAVVDVYLTTLGAVLLFGAIAIVGLGLVIGGLATIGEREVARVSEPTIIREVVLNQPIRTVTAYAALSELDLSILQLLSQGRNEGEIASVTGVALPIISEKIARLYIGGFITEKRALTERGFEAVRHSGELPLYVNYDVQ